MKQVEINAVKHGSRGTVAAMKGGQILACAGEKSVTVLADENEEAADFPVFKGFGGKSDSGIAVADAGAKQMTETPDR